MHVLVISWGGRRVKEEIEKTGDGLRCIED